MVVGLIYNNVDGCSDPYRELDMVKKSLWEAIPHVAPIQTGALAGNTVYTNPSSEPLLSSFQNMEATIKQLVETTNALKKSSDIHEQNTATLQTRYAALEKTSAALEKKSAALEKTSAALEKKSNTHEQRANTHEQRANHQQDELNALRPLKDTAIGIRERFLAGFLEGQAAGQIILGNRAVIEIGNKIAHEGDIVTDISLLKNRMIGYPTAFRRLYGLRWEDAITLLASPHMIEVMNCRATRIANGGREDQWRAQFNELLQWTRTATPEEISSFNANYSRFPYQKGLFRLLTSNPPPRPHRAVH
ncbi:hypothetical protein B9Z19DRAFT_487094 [Tuber borchii]|uniref:Uncharacterized protein n=1 Tax=Tuber borchii TaxID=42251 RepID=A0A2T6ZF04_TUBBO|nr:hypothetical protein B9Z19DRAFT_487094 [Tuber borchii]